MVSEAVFKYWVQFIGQSYQLCMMYLIKNFQVVSNFLELFNFTGDDDGEKRLVGQWLAAPQAKTGYSSRNVVPLEEFPL